MLEKLVGTKVLIRTVTFFQIGEITEISDGFIALDGASWVADTGRFGEAIKSGKLKEVEFLGDGVRVAIGAVVDITPWEHELPTKTQ
jgi:hypothetical protein